MNDRFKFRGKRLDNNQWYYGSYLYLHNAPEYDYAGNRKKTKKDVHFIIDENDISYAVDPETVGQCTGRHDKNGKLIYEGDILKYYQPYKEFKLYKQLETTKIQIVKWDAVGFTPFMYNAYTDDGSEWYEAENNEIIGNRYENKDLLNG